MVNLNRIKIFENLLKLINELKLEVYTSSNRSLRYRSVSTTCFIFTGKFGKGQRYISCTTQKHINVQYLCGSRT